MSVLAPGRESEREKKKKLSSEEAQLYKEAELLLQLELLQLLALELLQLGSLDMTKVSALITGFRIPQNPAIVVGAERRVTPHP